MQTCFLVFPSFLPCQSLDSLPTLEGQPRAWIGKRRGKKRALQIGTADGYIAGFPKLLKPGSSMETWLPKLSNAGFGLLDLIAMTSARVDPMSETF